MISMSTMNQLETFMLLLSIRVCITLILGANGHRLDETDLINKICDEIIKFRLTFKISSSFLEFPPKHLFIRVNNSDQYNWFDLINQEQTFENFFNFIPSGEKCVIDFFKSKKKKNDEMSIFTRINALKILTSLKNPMKWQSLAFLCSLFCWCNKKGTFLISPICRKKKNKIKKFFSINNENDWHSRANETNLCRRLVYCYYVIDSC